VECQALVQSINRAEKLMLYKTKLICFVFILSERIILRNEVNMELAAATHSLVLPYTVNDAIVTSLVTS
jgi:hypothetical protein